MEALFDLGGGGGGMRWVSGGCDAAAAKQSQCYGRNAALTLLFLFLSGTIPFSRKLIKASNPISPFLLLGMLPPHLSIRSSSIGMCERFTAAHMQSRVITILEESVDEGMA